jgi:hypothetical protein
MFDDDYPTGKKMKAFLFFFSALPFDPDVKAEPA